MSKYIPADKLKAELIGFRNIAREKIDDKDNYFLGMAQGYDNAIDIITSLQQEQLIEGKQVIIITETDGDANIHWDCRSLDDVMALLTSSKSFIADKQIEELRGKGSGPDHNTVEGRFRNAHKFQQEQPIGEENAIEIGKDVHTLRVGSRSDINRLIDQDKHEPAEGITHAEIKQAMDEVTKFKVFAADMAKRFNITNRRDIDWHNFCAGLLTYLKVNQPAEWSEEDETAFGDLMWCIEQAIKSAKDENDMGNIWIAENWLKEKLKSLRSRPKSSDNWKPSEVQPKDIVVIAKNFLEALSKTPYNNKPITDTQIIVRQLLLFLENPKEYNPDAILEQPEVELEKELDRYLRGEFQQTAGGNFNNYFQVARHFYELGLNARKEENK